ncbi:Leo1-like protein-domain-containing protein, partial [Vararia minispora EC-137]
WVLRLPNFLKMDHKPFHPDTYMGPEQEEDLARGNTDRDMVIKLRVENTIRWRWVKDATGQDRRQSNARIIRWSDGTSSLRLGKEYFDMNYVLDTSGSAHRQAFGAATGAPPPPGAGKLHGLTYLVAQHKRAELLQAEAAVAGHITLRPTDMASDAHRMLVRAVGQKHSKVARLRMADTAENQELQLQQSQAGGKAAGGKKRSKPRMEGEQPVLRRRRSSGAARRRANEDLWSDDDDEDEAEYAGSDDESPRKRRESERRGAGEYQTDDFLVDDDEDDDAGPASRKRGREAAGEDELERAEKALEARRRGGNGPGDDPGDEDGEGEMDVESEDEEEMRVRRNHTGPRKRRAFEEEEDE